MAAKRIGKSSIDWARFAERVPENQKHFFNSLKGRSELYLRKVLTNPESAPKIDFAAYKKRIPIPGLVDTFQKEYDSFTAKIPYPKEALTPLIDSQEKKALENVKQFIAESNKRIGEFQMAIAKWDDVLPYEEMTMEDYKDAFPDQALDPLKRPTFFPHEPEDQLGYKEPTPGSVAH